MGTRHLIGVFQDGEFKVAQYGQWDGYPEGVGMEILTFLKSGELPALRERCKSLKPYTPEQIEEMGKNENWKRDWPWLSRDCSADILGLIASGKCDGVKLSLDFADDSLFCEWAYVIDFDANVLEVYKGFQSEPHALGRFAKPKSEEGYFPIALKRSIPLDALPETKDQFCDPLYDKEEVAA